MQLKKRGKTAFSCSAKSDGGLKPFCAADLALGQSYQEGTA